MKQLLRSKIIEQLSFYRKFSNTVKNTISYAGAEFVSLHGSGWVRYLTFEVGSGLFLMGRERGQENWTRK
jgi:hypothetical protein